jgi:hypothetical protein
MHAQRSNTNTSRCNLPKVDETASGRHRPIRRVASMEMLLKVGMLPRKYGYDAPSLQQGLFIAGLQAIPI